MKRCAKCGAIKPLDQFYVDRAKADSRDSWCKDDRNKARRERYYANHDHELARCRSYYDRLTAEQKAAKVATVSAWRQANPEKVREAWRRQARNRPRRQRRQEYNPEQRRIAYLKRHGGVDEFARMYAEQGGLCYLCGETMEGVGQKYVHVDHDHDCCPGTKNHTESCKACRRGLAHAWCNQIIGLCGENMDTLRIIIANFEPARDAARLRIVTAKAAQSQLMPMDWEC